MSTTSECLTVVGLFHSYYSVLLLLAPSCVTWTDPEASTSGLKAHIQTKYRTPLLFTWSTACSWYLLSLGQPGRSCPRSCQGTYSRQCTADCLPWRHFSEKVVGTRQRELSWWRPPPQGVPRNSKNIMHTTHNHRPDRTLWAVKPRHMLNLLSSWQMFT